MKGIMGCDADWLKPGDDVGAADGRRMTILRKVDLAAAIEIAERVGDTSFAPVPNEHFYEVEIDLQAGVTNN
jgi:hypothetical protein